jgi:hypothetical protein
MNFMSSLTRFKMRAAAALFPALALLPAAAQACTVCFGEDPSSGLARGFYWGVVFLLTLPFTLFGVLAGLVVYHSRKNRARAAEGA